MSTETILTQEQKQDYFNRAVAGLKAQGYERSYYHGCKYRAPDGKKCAIGHLIPDEVYRPEFDWGTQFVEPLAAIGMVVDSDRMGPTWNFFNDLQGAHDLGGIPEVMKTHLRDFAQRYGLDASGVQ